MKCSFFQAAVISILLYGCTCRDDIFGSSVALSFPE